MSKDFNPGGTPGKLHRELGVATDKPIGAAHIAKATHSKDREVRDDAIRAQTMSHWNHHKAHAHHPPHDGNCAWPQTAGEHPFAHHAA